MWELLFSLPARYGIGIAESLLKTRRRRLRSWQEAATACGLQIEELSRSHALRLWLKAREGQLKVRIEQPLKRSKGCRIVIAAPGPRGFFGVRIRPEPERSGGHKIEIGDGPFDAEFYISGQIPLLFALLDQETRNLLIRVSALSQTPEVVYGELRVTTADHRIAGLLPLLLDLGRRFAQPLDIAQRLAENARRDPDAEVRLRTVLVLAREFPGAPAALAALRTACADASPRVRLWAAKELGVEGHEILLELAENAEDDLISAQAVSLLGQDLPIERTRTLLLQALRRRRHRTARVCLETLGRSTAVEDLDILVEVMAREQGDLAPVAATSLGAIGSPAAEPPLIRALQSEDLDLQTAAANALARLGTVAAVPPLKEVADRSAQEPDLFKATRQAIASIQSRLPGASPGQLSLASTEAGQLSLAQIEAGQLSLPAEESGQLSLSDGEED